MNKITIGSIIVVAILGMIFVILSERNTMRLMEIGDCVQEQNQHYLPYQDAWERWSEECAKIK
jgi:hypothetical protein